MGASQSGRIDWVDTAKGLCIVLVVMMHSTLGVGAATSGEGWMHAIVEYAKPFRIPGFFLVAGLFLARTIDRDWRDYIDRKVVHFAYFYVLWVTIQFAFKAPMFAADLGWRAVGVTYLESFVEPFGTLWFIYLLPIFFVTVKLARRVPAPAIWLVGAALEIAPIHTGWTIPDEFASRFVYFYTGYLLAPRIFDFAARVQAWPAMALGGLAAWALVNGTLIATGHAALPFVSLGLGLLGAAAVVAAAALLVNVDWMRWLRYCGEHSIVIYLAFFLPMAAMRVALLRTGIIADIGTVSALVTVAAVVGALAWYWAVRGTPLRFLFERPAWARLKPRRRAAMLPAE